MKLNEPEITVVMRNGKRVMACHTKSITFRNRTVFTSKNKIGYDWSSIGINPFAKDGFCKREWIEVDELFSVFDKLPNDFVMPESKWTENAKLREDRIERIEDTLAKILGIVSSLNDALNK